MLLDYERAFSEATGIPLKFQVAGQTWTGMRGRRAANPFCVHMAEMQSGCELCAGMQERLTDGETQETRSSACLAGLTDTSIPVKAGARILGYLQIGQVALSKLTCDDFHRIVTFLKRDEAEIDWETLEKEYFGTRFISRQQYNSVLRLLEIFAQHLALVAEQIATEEAHAQPEMVVQARQLIEQRHGEELSLSEVARAVNTSTFHFCKTFKKATGMTFTKYLALVRVSKAKKLLANPQARVTEVAYEAGFASLTHFNRMFRRIAGQSPTLYRVGLSESSRRASDLPPVRLFAAGREK